MACYKKEHILAKAEGKTQEKEADALCSTLFKLLMTWCVAEGNVFVWCFSLLMWHLMARTINVDSIALHNIKKGVSDSIVFGYDETKTDKSGEAGEKLLFKPAAWLRTSLLVHCAWLLFKLELRDVGKNREIVYYNLDPS
jgi:hypothetical protein